MNAAQARERFRWYGMLRRCEDPRAANYRYYGGRGITVCEQWHDFETYYADIMRLIGPCPEGMTLDRKDNTKGYEPGNVRWATRSQQQANSRIHPTGELRPCGTLAALARHRYHGEEPCTECKAAGAEYQRRRSS